jgi:DNA-binding LacI/PurR family transcriptional regulator
MKGPVTLHDVAEKAGVSVATASRALSSNKSNKKNHTKVREVAAQLGYVANESARSLRNVRTLTVGVVFNQLHDPLSTELLDALASALDRHGYSLFVATAQGVEERFDNLVHRFLERRVDALFCVNPSGEGAALARYVAASVPVICLFSKAGGYESQPLIASSIHDAVNQSLERLQSLGHQILGVISHDRRNRPLEGFRDVARKSGMTVRSYELPDGPIDAVNILNSMMNEPQRPTVLVARQIDAVRLFEAADALSILVPRVLSIIAIRDRTQQMPNTRLPLSMIHLNPGRVGVEAADALVKHLQGEKKLSANLAVEAGAWIEGGTIGTLALNKAAKSR